jgi:hypothetical protein
MLRVIGVVVNVVLLLAVPLFIWQGSTAFAVAIGVVALGNAVALIHTRGTKADARRATATSDPRIRHRN